MWEELKFQLSLQKTDEFISEVPMCYSSKKLDAGLYCETEKF